MGPLAGTGAGATLAAPPPGGCGSCTVAASGAAVLVAPLLAPVVVALGRDPPLGPSMVSPLTAASCGGRAWGRGLAVKVVCFAGCGGLRVAVAGTLVFLG